MPFDISSTVAATSVVAAALASLRRGHVGHADARFRAEAESCSLAAPRLVALDATPPHGAGDLLE
jgi:hypothetical protein